jgi:hypothetical protein
MQNLDNYPWLPAIQSEADRAARFVKGRLGPNAATVREAVIATQANKV